MPNRDDPASPAADRLSDELSTEGIVRRDGLDLDGMARRGAEDVAAGRVRPRTPR